MQLAVAMFCLVLAPSAAAAVPAASSWSVLWSDVRVTPARGFALDEPLQSLRAVIETEPAPGSGTDDETYLDIGPRWVELCERHRTGVPCDVTMPITPGLRVGDILWLRLHKKGGIGFDGFPGVDWNVASLRVDVNGRPFATVPVHRALTQRRPMFVARITDSYDPVELFRLALSTTPNEHPITFLGRALGFFTTPFLKLHNVSGWKETDVPMMRVAGIVYRRPARSTDGLATIDVAVQSAGPAANAPLVPVHCRFLRIEYRWEGRALPDMASMVDVSGPVKWDTDDEGWFELHPSTSSEVRSQPATQASRAALTALLNECIGSGP